MRVYDVAGWMVLGPAFLTAAPFGLSSKNLIFSSGPLVTAEMQRN